MSGSFSGFPREGFDFLRDVATNNNKPWFEANRRGYDEGSLDQDGCSSARWGWRCRSLRRGFMPIRA